MPNKWFQYASYAAFIALVAFGLTLHSQTVVPQPTSFLYTVQTLPAAIPTSTTCIVGFAVGCLLRLVPGNSDPYLCGADFTATGQTITMTDGSAIPWVVAGGVLGGGTTPTGWVFVAPNDAACRIFPGGVNITSNGAGATGRLTIKYNK